MNMYLQRDSGAESKHCPVHCLRHTASQAWRGKDRPPESGHRGATDPPCTPGSGSTPGRPPAELAVFFPRGASYDTVVVVVVVVVLTRRQPVRVNPCPSKYAPNYGEARPCAHAPTLPKTLAMNQARVHPSRVNLRIRSPPSRICGHFPRPPRTDRCSWISNKALNMEHFPQVISRIIQVSRTPQATNTPK